MKTGRPKKLVFGPDDEAVKELMELMEEKIFQLNGKKSNQEKADFLVELAEEHGITRLAASELKDHFISPYLNRNNIKLSKEYCDRIYELLQKIKVGFGFEKQIATLEKFRVKILETVSASREDDQKIQQAFPKILLSLKGNPFLKYLERTEWLVYERMGERPFRGEEWGLAVSKLFFTSDQGYLGVEMQSNYEQIRRTHTGIASADAQRDYLFIDLIIMDKSEKRANLVLRLADTDPDNQSIMIGHYTYHSRRYNHLLSKSVVLHQIKNDSQDNKPSIEIGDYFFTDENYRDIPPEIRNFLYSREMNRVSLPHTIISDLHELEKFHKNHRVLKINHVLQKYFCGNYYLYYKNSSGKITEDDISIDYNSESILIESTYSHKPDRLGKILKTWIGRPSINPQKSAVSIPLSNEKYEGSREEDPILLTFWIPDETISYGECQCFPGIISGLEDSTKGPIGFVCLLVKKGIENFTQENDTRLTAFFESNHCLEIAPKLLKFKLNDFKTV